MFELRIRGATEKAREGNYGHGDEGGGGGEGRGEGLFSIPPSAHSGRREANQRKEGREGGSTRLLAEQATRKIGHTGGEGETANGSDIANDLPPAPTAPAIALFVRKSVMLVGQSSE